MSRIERESRGRMRPTLGSVYPALRQLEGLVRSWLEPPRGKAGRPRRYYELTLSGVGVATAQRAALSAFINGTAAPSVPEGALEQMRARLQRSAELSAACMKLRQAAEDLP